MRTKPTVDGNPRPSNRLAGEVQIWEWEGGGLPSPPESIGPPLSGTEAEVEWATRIRTQVNAEFERVRSSFRSIAAKEIRGKRAETDAILALLEDKRREVMGRTRADYFMHDWREIGDQVIRLFFEASRCEAGKSQEAQRHLRTNTERRTTL